MSNFDEENILQDLQSLMQEGDELMSEASHIHPSLATDHLDATLGICLSQQELLNQFSPKECQLTPSDNVFKPTDRTVDKASIDITHVNAALKSSVDTEEYRGYSRDWCTLEKIQALRQELVQNHQQEPDAVIKIITDFCRKPGVLVQMIESLHREIERNTNLITMLRSILNRTCHNKGMDERDGQCNKCQVDMKPGCQYITDSRATIKQLFTMVKEKQTCQTVPSFVVNNEDAMTADSITEVPEIFSQTAGISEEASIDREDERMKTKEQVTDVCRDKSSQINAINGEKTLSSKENVNTQHQKYQGADNMYTCEDCDFKTKQLKNLNGHLLSHHNKEVPGLKSYSCQYCDYKCVDRQRLKEHEPIHTGIKQFKCGNCEKAFGTKRGLRTHLKFHSSERPHKCSQCDAAFKVRPKLRDHIKLVHTKKGEKPFQCGYCEHRASVRGNVNQHIRNIHKGKPVMVVVVTEKKDPLR